jgi:hypothetical protein
VRLTIWKKRHFPGLLETNVDAVRAETGWKLHLSSPELRSAKREVRKGPDGKGLIVWVEIGPNDPSLAGGAPNVAGQRLDLLAAEAVKQARAVRAGGYKTRQAAFEAFQKSLREQGKKPAPEGLPRRKDKGWSSGPNQVVAADRAGHFWSRVAYSPCRPARRLSLAFGEGGSEQMVLDQFEVRVDPAHYIRWPGGGGFQPVELRVNGVGLIDIIREVELPYAQREYDERTAAGESGEGLGPRGALAGDYLYLPASEVFLPSRNLLGEPYRHGFVTEPDDPRDRKSLLLSCTCGITDCWFLLATITVSERTVEWSDFCQFHRDWRYDLGSFVFDRTKYEAQLVRA